MHAFSRESVLYSYRNPLFVLLGADIYFSESHRVHDILLLQDHVEKGERSWKKQEHAR